MDLVKKKRRTVVRHGEPTVFRLRKKDLPKLKDMKILVKPGKSVKMEPCRCFDCQLLNGTREL